jgi:hypothetical protein
MPSQDSRNGLLPPRNVTSNSLERLLTLSTPPHIYPGLRYVGFQTGAPKPMRATLAPLGSDLCRILEIDFGESTFYALRSMRAALRRRDEAQQFGPFLCWWLLKERSHSDVGPYVLVEAEEVVRVIATLERLERVVLLGPIGLADPLLALLHEEVHVDARVVGLEG